uniref:Putative lipase ATG15 n=1 Tax=Pichia angusta TaxID=870730 RepID=ATG15_PICAN|nr:RecName: Full=Putative lipase ATG15; AltName: Full=Autophagy-related protein 15 [Ogataea angusta]ABO31059.1 Atg15p [Ogataea angusta]
MGNPTLMRWPVTRILVLGLVVTVLYKAMAIYSSRRAPVQVCFTSPSSAFKIKHIFHNAADGRTHKRLDIDDEFLSIYNSARSQMAHIEDMDLFTVSPFEQELVIRHTEGQTVRLADRSPDFVESYLDYALENGPASRMIEFDWQQESLLIPNMSDKETIVSLALMSSDAYVGLPTDADWNDVGDKYNESERFGWENGGVRGHVFTDPEETIVIISIKGTSAAGLNTGGDGQTVEQDKTNDNLLFSCCCARVSSLWKTVCDCYEESYTCNQNCLEQELRRPDRYYKAVLEIYRNVTHMYPESEIWVTGHSLGGSLSSLLGRTFGLPAVSFEAVGELLATRRLHLPMPPGLPEEMENIWHVGNTADPIFMGVCNGASSTCSLAGYALETQCHSGKKCVYDVVNDLGWHVNLLNHRIRTIISDVLMVYNDTAECVKPPPCYDCYNWRFVDHSGDRYRTTASSPSPIPSDPPGRRCLKRTWYGRCYEWADDPSAVKTTFATSTIYRKTSDISTSTHTGGNTTCIRRSWLGYCLEYGPELR